MEELSDKELLRVRLRFIDLIKSFFAKEPDAELMSRWRGTFSALSKEQISPRFDASVKEMVQALNRKNLQELEDEFYTLFVDPFEGAQLELTASYYLNGRSYDQSLVGVRQIMKEASIELDSEIKEPEDDLVVMLDTFGSLLEEEVKGEGESARLAQRQLFKEYLEPFSQKFSEVLKLHKEADFYYLCSRVLCGYLDLEKGLVVSS